MYNVFFCWLRQITAADEADSLKLDKKKIDGRILKTVKATAMDLWKEADKEVIINTEIF